MISGIKDRLNITQDGSVEYHDRSMTLGMRSSELKSYSALHNYNTKDQDTLNTNRVHGTTLNSSNPFLSPSGAISGAR